MRYNKSPLKWAGSKNKALQHLLPIINQYQFDLFVEPFVGAANVSLNVDAEAYWWNDLNKDLINTFEEIFSDVDDYIAVSQIYFDMGFSSYNKLRDKFNSLDINEEPFLRAALFQYLNKHGFNGLCRYNKDGKFNVPKGSVTKKPKQVPVEQIMALHNKFVNEATVLTSSQSFEKVFKWVGNTTDDEGGVLVYCDPPYVPLTSDFKYTKDGFNLEDQEKLKECASKCKHTVLISNHWTEYTKELYSDASETHVFDVQRTISCDGGNRKKVQEVVAVY